MYKHNKIMTELNKMFDSTKVMLNPDNPYSQVMTVKQLKSNLRKHKSNPRIREMVLSNNIVKIYSMTYKEENSFKKNKDDLLIGGLK